MVLEEIASANNLIVNVIIILLNICNSESVCFHIYVIFNNILRDLQIKNHNQKLLAIKLYVWMALPFVVFIILIVMEFIYATPPYTLVVKMPTFLSILHLVIHLSLTLAILKVINLNISQKFKRYNNFCLPDLRKTKGRFYYILHPGISFFDVQSQKEVVDLKLLRNIYDDLGVCINLLQRHHGIQMLLSIWLMFSNAVTGITLIINERVNMAWIVVARSTLPFFWYFSGCYVNNQLQQEVEQTDLLIIKYMIDFRCDKPTRDVLQTFRQVIDANRLEFTACNLFRLNYSTILATVVNVITYSIILIQIL
ncbi:uncharacterized protein [Epargyreus clarus]|uniref:uncharacterized protein n=1 Tax=Epargyreus clarus TaxID=520877 RepID=UPI003C306682